MKFENIFERSQDLFVDTVQELNEPIEEALKGAKVLVIGGAGSIGQAVSKEVFKYDPKLLHIVDISENNLVELVRHIRSSYGYGTGEFETFAIDYGSRQFEQLFHNTNGYDYIFNLAALKHVRSESDAYTLLRLVEVNVFFTLKSIQLANLHGCRKYFCVSSDKATNPVNLMGASKRAMEIVISDYQSNFPISMARFANVAFSDGSLLHGFEKRFDHRQPITAPHDVRRYFISDVEAGQICLLSTIFGEDNEIFFPNPDVPLEPFSFSQIAKNFLRFKGYEAVPFETEQDARRNVDIINRGEWPVYFFGSDTTGEKDLEEFYDPRENLKITRFPNIGIVDNQLSSSHETIAKFCNEMTTHIKNGYAEKADIINSFTNLMPNFKHIEKGKFLNQRM